MGHPNQKIAICINDITQLNKHRKLSQLPIEHRLMIEIKMFFFVVVIHEKINPFVACHKNLAEVESMCLGFISFHLLMILTMFF